MFTLRFRSMLTSPVSPGRSSRWDISDRQRVHPLWLALVLYSLLLQHFPLTWLNPPVRTNIRQEGSTTAPPKLHLQYTSAGHVLGFGASQIVVGHPTHALTMTMVDAKPVNPTAEPDRLPGDSSEPFHLRHPGESRGPESSKTLDTGFRRYDSQKAKTIQSDMSQPFTGSVRYDNPWPGVSVIYRAQAGAILKSEYHLAPGFSAKTINQIRIRYNRPIKLDSAGRLVVHYAFGYMQESAPVAWQEIDGKRMPVKVKFSLRGKQAAGFSVSGYDPKYALVIDPSLTWNTFLGGGGSDFGYGISVDGSGNIYVCGYSTATWGSPVRAYTSGEDFFAAKLDRNGNLIWHTFLGGTGTDYGYAISVDGSGHVYVSGYSNATWGSPIRAYTSVYDAFAAKLDSFGNLIWNTFLGDAGTDYGYAISVDGSGNSYVCGFSTATWGSPIRSFTSGGDAFAAKLDSFGNLIWNTFLGGIGGDSGDDITVDGSGNVYVGGYSVPSWGSPVRAYTDGYDAFAAKLDSFGNLIWHTFLGGSENDYGYGISVDGSSNVYVGGMSYGTWGSPVRAYKFGIDGFAAKLDSSGNLIWNTFLGGNGNDYGRDISLDVSGNIYVGGDSNATWGSPVYVYTSGYDAFAAKLDSSGNLIWNMFLGGTGDDSGRDLSLDVSGNVYVGGHSSAAWGSPVRAYTNNDDAMAVKISDIDLTQTCTPTSAISLTLTATPSPTSTLTLSPSATRSSTATQTPNTSSTPSRTPSIVLSPTLSPTRTFSSTRTSSPSVTCSPTPSPVLSATATATQTPTHNPAFFTTTPTPVSSTQDFVRLRSHLLHVNRGDSLALTLSMSQAGQVNIRLYDLSGRRVMEIMDSQQPAGTQLITHELSALGSGTYILLAEAGEQRARFKLVVLH